MNPVELAKEADEAIEKLTGLIQRERLEGRRLRAGDELRLEDGTRTVLLEGPGGVRNSVFGPP